ncbi:hypothetical protein [Rubrobacter tropicus]|uniref:hypothetical protein n=1 Tax=Rubrobacter tropicus TaxID=2653851 RepID=UPI001409CF67|nr:hypothetical protein [Rubrobacter tropicus]
MDHAHRRTERAKDRGPDGTAPAFAAFVLRHAGCGRGASESRLDGDTLACWCPPCGELMVFAPEGREDGEGRKKIVPSGRADQGFGDARPAQRRKAR